MPLEQKEKKLYSRQEPVIEIPNTIEQNALANN
jgi:hypothetical protein